MHGVFLDLASVDNGDLDRSSLEACLPRWDWHGYTSAAEASARIFGADVVVTNKCALDRQALSTASLKLVAVAATGTNNVDLTAAHDLGVTVCNIRDYCSESVAQHAITLLLNLLTGQPWYWQRVRQGEWSGSSQFALHDRPIREARGLALGVIGYGSLGQAVAGKARALDMQVLVAERKGQAPRPGRLAFEQVLQRADAISLHCPLTEDTRDLLSRAELRSMKPTALLINTARGGIVNERDLAASLRAGEIAGAAVDTLDIEPPPAGHPLLAVDIPNLLVTPHNAWASRTARQAALDQLADVITAYLAGAPINVVTG